MNNVKNTCVLIISLFLAFGSIKALALSDEETSSNYSQLEQLEESLRQRDANLRYRIPDDQPISERLRLEYGASLRQGILSVEDAAGGNTRISQSEALFYSKLELDGAHRLFGRLRFLYEDSNAPDPDIYGKDVDGLDAPVGDRYWYEYDQRGAELASTGIAPDSYFRFRGGRQFVNWGAGAVLSGVTYSADLTYHDGPWEYRGFVGSTVGNSGTDFDVNRPNYSSESDRTLYGFMIRNNENPTFEPYAYFFAQDDRNDVTPVEPYQSFLTGELFEVKFEQNTRYLGIGANGTLSQNLIWGGEFVYEFGDTLSSDFIAIDPSTGFFTPSTQTRDDINAFAFLLTGRYLMGGENDLIVTGQFAYGSGDDDNSDPGSGVPANRGGTKHAQFSALGYVDTGLVVGPSLSNLTMLRLGVDGLVAEEQVPGGWSLRGGVKGYILGKSESSAPLSVPSVKGRLFGTEVDAFLQWRLASDTDVQLQYGVFFPSTAAGSGQAGEPRDYFYAGMNLTF